MKSTIFLCATAILAFCFGLANGIQFLIKRNRTAQTTGTIVSIKTPNPENSGFHNSKWAAFSYKANGRTYLSQNRIQVPATSQTGTKMTVRYDIRHPEKLYSFSLMRMAVSFFITAICIVLAMFSFV